MASELRRAERAVVDARRRVEGLHQRVLEGDETVTAAMLGEADGAVQLSVLQLERLRRAETDAAGQLRRQRAERGAARRRAAHEKVAHAQRDGERRARESGLAAAVAADLARNNGAPVTFDGALPDAVHPDEVAPVRRIGTPLRDAAVNPRPSDYLPPSNAGQADPTSPFVVAPELPDVK